jgi:hypothetical protein
MVYAITSGTILIIAILGGIYFARKNSIEKENQVKVMLFVLYFWLLVFIQVILFALGYYAYGNFN